MSPSVTPRLATESTKYAAAAWAAIGSRPCMESKHVFAVLWPDAFRLWVQLNSEQEQEGSASNEITFEPYKLLQLLKLQCALINF